MIHTTNDSRGGEWCKTSGYYSDPQSWQESYDYRPGLTFTDAASAAAEFPPSGLPDIFGLLGKASRLVLDAIGFYLNLRSSPFTEILDNVPLRSNEVSSSVLSVCCYARPSFHHGGQHHHTLTEDEQLLLYSDHDHQLDKSLISFVKSDKAGLHIRDMHGQWILVDVDLGPQEAVVFPGLALYQATAGYVSPAVYRTDLNSMQGSIEGRFSLAFKLMPKSMTNLSCSEMRAAGHGVDAQFQVPVSVDDFMQRPHSNDELFNRQTLQSFGVPPQSQDGNHSLLFSVLMHWFHIFGLPLQIEESLFHSCLGLRFRFIWFGYFWFRFIVRPQSYQVNRKKSVWFSVNFGFLFCFF